MAEDLEALAEMEYPGRFIIVGKSLKEENSVVVYGVTGRSTESQARELVEGEKTGVIRTEVTDPEVLKKGSEALLIYPAIIPVIVRNYAFIAASNGYQTNLLCSALINNMNECPELPSPTDLRLNEFSKTVILGALCNPFWIYDKKDDRFIDVTTYEPDSNNTPRINLVASTEEACLHLVRCENGERRDEYHTFDLSSLMEGKGRFISTYNGINQEPLQSFQGEPFEIELPGVTPKQTAEAIYKALEPKEGKLDLRVGVACVYFKKIIISEVSMELFYEKAIINKNGQVGQSKKVIAVYGDHFQVRVKK